MADIVRVSTLRENITECPICTEEFDDKSKIPRRMPSCGQPICEECLVRYVRRRTVFPCPLCKVNNNIPGGVRSLSTDMTVLRLLEVLKIQKTKPQSTGDGRGPGASSEEAAKLKEKQDKIIKKMTKLFSLEENIDMSEKIAKGQINQRFEDMVEELQQRRVILLSEVEVKAVQERRSVTRAKESHKSLLAKLISASDSGQSVASLLEETPDDVDADRIGVAFTEVNMTELLATIRSAGQVRILTFTPTQKPDFALGDDLWNVIAITPVDSSEVAVGDLKITTNEKELISPLLEYDHNTASADVSVSTTAVSNIKPYPAPFDTGCRFQLQRRAVAVRPLSLRRGQVIVICSRVEFTVKEQLSGSVHLWEMSVTNSPVDCDFHQPSGVGLTVRVCDTHRKQICICVVNERKLVYDVPFTKYQEGASRDLQVYVMIDRDANKIHIVDSSSVKVIATSDVPPVRQLWVLTYVANPSSTKMRSQLISGKELKLSQKMKMLLSSLL